MNHRVSVLCRAVHGAAAPDHRVREQGGDVRHGGALPDRSGRYGGRVLRRGPPRHASARRHRPGTFGGQGKGGKTDRYHTYAAGKVLPAAPARARAASNNSKASSLRCFFSRSPRARSPLSPPLAPPWPFALGGQHKSYPFFGPLFLTVCALLVFGFFPLQNGGTSRQLCPRALSPSSSQRSTTCTLTFSAPRKSPPCRKTRHQHGQTQARTKICSKILSSRR